MHIARTCSSLVVLAGLGGCGAASLGGDDAAAADLASGDAASDGAAGDGAAGDCSDAVGERALGGVCVRQVTGRLVDEGGAPIAGAVMTVCASACFYGMSDGDGRFTVPVGQYIQAPLYSLLAHVNPRRAPYYLPLPAPERETIALGGPVTVLPLPAAGPAIVADGSPQQLVSGGVTLAIEAGTTLFFSVEDTADMPLGSEFRVLSFTRFDGLAFLGGLAPAALYGFGPFEIDFRKPVRLSFENLAALPAGAAVDVLAQRGLIRNGPPGARFDVVAAARVSDDGQRIDMEPGAGLDSLTWVALRKKEH